MCASSKGSLLNIAFGICASFIFSTTAIGEEDQLRSDSARSAHLGSPSISADGQLFCYATACTGNGDIYIFDNRSSQSTRLTASEDAEFNPHITADSKRIVYSLERDGARNVWKMSSDGSGKVQITQGPSSYDVMTLSSNGRFAIVSRSERATGLAKTVTAYLLSLTQKDTELLPLGVTAVFSRDSKYVIYADSGKMWQLNLDEEPFKRQKLDLSGIPSDVSDDAGWILETRWNDELGDFEVWSHERATNHHFRLGDGHSPIFIEPTGEYVLYISGLDAYVCTKRGEKAILVDFDYAYLSYPCALHQGGAIFCGYPRLSDSDFEVVQVEVNGRSKVVGFVGCNRTTFNLDR